MEHLSMTETDLTRLEAMHRLENRGSTQQQVACDLGLSERQVGRLWRAFRQNGPPALISKRRGKPSNRRLSAEWIAEILAIVRELYPDFGPTFANQKLREKHGVTLCTESLRTAMIAAGIWKPKARKRRVHPLRERRECFGELIQADGSPHAWFEDRGPRCVLLTSIDDATSRICAARLVEAESTEAYFALFEEHFMMHGLPRAFYVDKHGVFRVNTSNAIGQAQTQAGRALEELHIELICANSPQAKGRVERANRTNQNRLVKELRLRNINTIDDGNAFLPEFLADYNARFAKKPACPLDAHRPIGSLDLKSILCKKFQATISKNLMLQFRNTIYALTDDYSRMRLRAGVRVDIALRPQNAMTITHQGRELGFILVLRQTKKAAIVGAKDLNTHIDRRIPNPKKAHTPAPNHPWKVALHKQYSAGT
jgi:transposase